MSAEDNNELADIDFADELAAGFVNQPDNLMNINILRRMDPNLVMVLQGFPLEEKVYERFYNNGVKYSELASLSRIDLELMGVTEIDIQDEMLNEFATLQGQHAPFARIFRMHRENQHRLDVENSEQNVSVLHMLQHQMMHINTLLSATILKVRNSKSLDAPGVIVNNRFESHEVVLEMLERMNEHSCRMLEIIQILQQQPDDRTEAGEIERKKKSKLKKITVKSLLIASGIIFGFILVKHFRGSR